MGARAFTWYGAGNTLGQDLNLSLDRVLASRNFANKLWNAGKFIDFNLAQVRWLKTCLLRCTRATYVLHVVMACTGKSAVCTYLW